VVKDETDAFIEAFTSSDSADDEVAALVDELVDMKSDMYDSLLPYVDVDQEDEFNIYVEELLVQFEVNYTKRLNNFIDHKESDDDDSVNKGRKLPERFRGKIGQFMKKWDDSEKGDLLQTILTKIEVKMSQIESLDTISEENQQLLLDYLSDLYDMVQDEYNSLVTDSDDITEDELFDDIFGDDDSDDSDDDSSEDEVEGTVTSIEGMYVALTNGKIIKVLDSTDVENDGDLLSLAAVEDALAGDETVSVEAEGEYNADDVFVATTIKFETGSTDDEDEEDDDSEDDDEDDDNGGDDDDEDDDSDDDEDEDEDEGDDD